MKDLVVNCNPCHEVLTNAGDKISAVEAIAKPFVDRISASTGRIKDEPFDDKLSRLQRIFENDKCVHTICLSAKDKLMVEYTNVQSNVYLSDDNVEISENFFIRECCKLVSESYFYAAQSIADKASMLNKARHFLSTENNTLPVLFLIKSNDADVPTDVLKVFAYHSELYLKATLSDEAAVFVDVSIDKLYRRLINFIFNPTNKFKHLFSNFSERETKKNRNRHNNKKNNNEQDDNEYFGCGNSDIRINKRTFEIRFNNFLPFVETADVDDDVSKFANLFIQWYNSIKDDDDDDDAAVISFSKQQIRHFIETKSVVQTYYPIENTYVFEKVYREYVDEIVEEEERKEEEEAEEKDVEAIAMHDPTDPFRKLLSDVSSVQKNVHNEEDEKEKEEEEEEEEQKQKATVFKDNIFHVEKDVFVYDFKNFSASILLHCFPHEPIISETIRLLIALKEIGGVLSTASKSFLLKLFGYSKRFICPFYHFCNNFGIYFMCRLANLFIGKTLICSRDAIFLREAIDDFSIFDDGDDFYENHLVMENHFDRFYYSDYQHYVGYSSSSSSSSGPKVVLKGFCQKNIPRFQIDLMKGMFLDYFQRAHHRADDFDFWASFNHILQSFDGGESLTFPYSGITNARFFYYNRLAEDFFVYSDEIGHCTLDQPQDIANSSKISSFRSIGRCYNLCFNEYLKHLTSGIVQDKFFVSILKVDESVLLPFRSYCARFMNVSGSSCITPNLMGSYVYSGEYLQWETCGGADI